MGQRGGEKESDDCMSEESKTPTSETQHHKLILTDVPLYDKETETLEILQNALQSDPRPLVFMFSPSEGPGTCLATWKGKIIETLLSIDISVTKGRTRIILIKHISVEESEESKQIWAEISASGVIVQERDESFSTGR